MQKVQAKGLRTWAGAALWMASVAALAQQAAPTPAGVVQMVRGDVRIERDGQQITPDAGTPVMARDRIVTQPLSSVGITMRDNTRIALGGRSNVVLEQYQFTPETNDGSLVMRVLRGTLGTVTGLIARKPSNQVEVRTKTATAGVRGTEFLVEVPDNEN